MVNMAYIRWHEGISGRVVDPQFKVALVQNRPAPGGTTTNRLREARLKRPGDC